jgi:uncharacterized membrane protein
MQNIHPLFVHFPIALFTIFTILEILPWKRFQRSRSGFLIKATFIIIGSLSSLVTLKTGEMAEHALGNNVSIRNLVETHSTFANAASYIYGFIALLYLITLIERYTSIDDKSPQLVSILNRVIKIKNYSWKRFFLVPLAIIGLVLITITGSLGGAIVYGPDIDPVVKFIYTTFVN